MSFTLEKAQGKGKSTVKVTADENKSSSSIIKQILVQVNGVTKQVIQLVQKGAIDYKVFIKTDKASISAAGGDIKVTYWVTLNGEAIDVKPTLKGTTNIISSGVDDDGKNWIIDRLPANSGGANYTASYTYNGTEISASSTIPQDVMEVKLYADKSNIPGYGGSVTFTYYGLENGNRVTNDIELKLVGTADIQYKLEPQVVDSNGITQILTLGENNTGSSKSLQFKAINTVTGAESDTITITQEDRSITVYCQLDKTELPYSGGTAKLTYWAKDQNGIINTDLSIVEDEDGMNYDISEGTINSSTNKLESIITISPYNQNDHDLELRIYAVYNNGTINRRSEQVTLLYKKADLKAYIEIDPQTISGNGGKAKLTFWGECDGVETTEGVTYGLKGTANDIELEGVGSESIEGNRKVKNILIKPNNTGRDLQCYFGSTYKNTLANRSAYSDEVPLYQKKLNIEVHIEVDNTEDINDILIDHTGGTKNIRCWYELDGVESDDGVEIVIEGLQSTDYSRVSKEVNKEKYYDYTFKENDSSDIKEGIIYAIHTDSGTRSVSIPITIMSKEVIVLPDSDFLALELKSDKSEGGRDLIWAANIKNTGINVNTTNVPLLLDDIYVELNTGTVQNLHDKVYDYIKHLGNYAYSLDGGIVINLSKLVKDSVNKSENIIVTLYGNYTYTRASGDVTVKAKCYRGVTGVVNYPFEPADDTTEVYDFESLVNCNALCYYNKIYTDSYNGNTLIRTNTNQYSILAQIEHDIKTGKFYFKPYTKKSGRNVSASVDVKVTGEFRGSTSSPFNSTVIFDGQGSGSLLKSSWFTINSNESDGSIIFSNGKETLDYDPEKGESTVTSYPIYIDESTSTISMASEAGECNFEHDTDGNCIGIKYKFNENTSGKYRTLKCKLRFQPSVKTPYYGNYFDIDIEQVSK